MIRRRKWASAGALPGKGRGRFFAVFALLFLAATAGCKENLNAPPTLNGADTSGPFVELLPFNDTTVDSSGVLLIAVAVRDPSGVKLLEFNLLPAAFGFPTLAPLDTLSVIVFPVQLSTFKHSTFRFYVRARDVLDYETVTDTVTVTVR